MKKRPPARFPQLRERSVALVATWFPGFRWDYLGPFVLCEFCRCGPPFFLVFVCGWVVGL